MATRRAQHLLIGTLIILTTSTMGARRARASSAPRGHGVRDEGDGGRRPRATGAHERAAAAREPLSRERLERAELGRSGRYEVSLDGHARAELTFEPRLQRLAERVVRAHEAPYAAAMLVSVADGRVLAMAGRSTAEPARSAWELCLAAWADAASIFKLATAAALLEAGLSPQSRVCYHDGLHSIEASNLTSHPRLDTDCNSLAYGVAKSQNAIVGRLAADHLDADTLGRAARALGFGERLPSDVPIATSRADIPPASDDLDEKLAFARVAAGFHHTTLSVAHGAWLAAAIARGGLAPAIRFVQRVTNGSSTSGVSSSAALDPGEPQRVLDESVARALGRMMVGTTEYGTAQRGFHDHRGRPFLPGIVVAGKTGTLNRKEGPYLSYSWFVGYAPASHPQVAVSVLVGNGDNRVVKAHQVARELLQAWFHKQGDPPLVAAR